MIQSAKAELGEYHQANNYQHQNTSGRQKLIYTEKPDGISLEANLDASIDFKSLKMGITSVIRDSEGSILASLCAFKKK